MELVLPIPKDPKLRKQIIDQVANVISLKTSAKQGARTAVLTVAPTEISDPAVEYEFLTMKR
jgi:hypothetical protein